MNRHGSFDDKDDASDADETSGVTSLAPVPVKTTRLNGFDFDRTHFFDVSTLLERGKAIAARAQASEHARAEATAPSAEQPLPALPVRPSIWRQFREASLARQASAIMLPLLIGLLLVKPVFKKPEPTSAGQPVPSALSAVHTPNVLAPAPEPEPEPVLAPTPAEPPPSLPRGVTLEKAAVDAVAGGDFGRALTLYRELAGRSPNNAAYHQAVVVLERRQRAPAP